MAEPARPQIGDDPQYLVSEETPLLPEVNTATALEDEEDPRDKYKWPVILITFSLIFLLELSVGVSTPAWNALLEKGLCAEAHPELAQILVAGDDNEVCKHPDVQGRLAMYRGWSYTLECVPTILLAVPYGLMSDRWGRKPVALLAFAGIALITVWYEVVFYFPLPMWTFLLAFICYVIGGGSNVGTSMLYTILADVVHADELASVLFRFFAVFMVSSLIANPLGGFLLSQGPWVALLTGNLFMLISIAALYLLPETLLVRRWHDAKAGKTAGPSRSPTPQGVEDDEGLKKSEFRAVVDAVQAQLHHGLDFFVNNKRVVVLMMPLVFETVETYVVELLMQYSTKRHDFANTFTPLVIKASYFLTLKSASYIIMLTVLLPAISTFCLTTLGMSPLKKDLWLARWSAALIILAELVISLSYTPALYALGLVLLAGGCGLPPLLRSLLNALVEPHHVGILNTLLGFLDTLGVMIAAPIFSQALGKGIQLGGGWIGLPFAAGACIAALATGILWAYRLPAVPPQGRDDGEGGDGV
ncbi:hypothetical protein VMCG_08796 [Cytospora schulzeri]|uniref:Major facilitator superfamily (MFS) profile domain-containing protein n=1 Tax=Cytospora schulzeri TaxID=448051 RepID=A0A423VS02_9PEZI|nr:hypothetical protein VMCG_08796 [Valsa malicola]